MMRPKGAPGPGGPKRTSRLSGTKPKNAFAVLRRLFSYVGRDKMKIPFVFVCVLLSALAGLGGSYILRPIINNLVYEGKTTAEKLSSLLMGILIMAGIYFVGVLCNYLQQRIMVQLSQNSLVRIRKQLFSKIQRLPVKYHDTHTHGEIMSRFTNDLEAVGQMLNNTLPQIFSGVITLIGTIVLMFVTNWVLALITLATVPVFVYAGGAIGKRSRKYYAEQQRALGAVNGYVEETITGLKVVKVFCHEETSVEEFSF